MKDTLVQIGPNHQRSQKMKASQVRKLSKEKRAKYMIEHTAQAAKEYNERPELMI
jgi:hypothetical protein